MPTNPYQSPEERGRRTRAALLVILSALLLLLGCFAMLLSWWVELWIDHTVENHHLD